MDPPVPSETSVFHHRGGLQVSGGADYRDPAFMAAASAGRPPSFLGGPQQIPSDYPYQNQLGQQQQQLGQPGFVFPGNDNNNPNNFLPNPYSPYVQQFQQQYSSQFAPQYGLQPRLPPPVAGQPPQQQLLPAVVPEPTINNVDPAVTGSASSTTEKLPLTTTKTTRSTTASTTASLSEVIRRHTSVLAFVEPLLFGLFSFFV
jgi:hypothetical protein